MTMTMTAKEWVKRNMGTVPMAPHNAYMVSNPTENSMVFDLIIDDWEGMLHAPIEERTWLKDGEVCVTTHTEGAATFFILRINFYEELEVEGWETEDDARKFWGEVKSFGAT